MKKVIAFILILIINAMSNEIANTCEANGGNWNWNGNINKWCCNDIPSDEFIISFLKAGADSNASRQMLIGNIYYVGEAVNKDLYKAFYWFKKSANQGNTEAQAMIGMMYIRGEGTQVNNFKAIEFSTQACDANISRSCDELGTLYQYGRGAKQNIVKAGEVYKKACSLGYVKSCERIELLSETKQIDQQHLEQKYNKSTLAQLPIPQTSKLILDGELTKENQEKIEEKIIEAQNKIKNNPSESTRELGINMQSRGDYGLGLNNFKKVNGVYTPKSNLASGLNAAVLILDLININSNTKKESLTNENNIDLGKETILKCTIHKILGEPRIFYNAMYVVNRNDLIVGLNALNVNDYYILDKSDYEFEYYSSTRATFLHNETKFGGLVDKAKTFYDCEEVPNGIFKSEEDSKIALLK